ncbi:MAG: histone deacetylase family protein [Planctomycetota bacterium]|jgi:acetoin utilization deacetylase AcuC-like enzyme
MADETLLFYHEAMLEHDAGPGHPERPARLQAICQALERSPIPSLRWTAPSPAGRGPIERVHDPTYVDRLDSVRGRSTALDLDTAVSPGSLPAAYLAAGAAIDAVSAVFGGSARRGMALVRPPGHHAEADRAMGFCLFNNIAVAAAHARAALGCRRALIVDWDVHHGNGTQHAFFDRGDVLFFSTHRFPFYPGSGSVQEIGAGDGTGFTINVPLPAGFGDNEYDAVFSELLTPAADAFEPDLVLVSAGFDAHRRDPLGGMVVTGKGFASLCQRVCDLADRHAQGRIVMVLEGGYDLTALAESVHACLRVLGGSKVSLPGPPDHAAGAVIRQVRDVHRPYWPL